MKAIIIFFAILICSTSFGQFEKLKGTWITPDQDFFEILEYDNNNIWVQLSNKMGDNKALRYSNNFDTLKMFERNGFCSRSKIDSLVSYETKIDTLVLSKIDTLFLYNYESFQPFYLKVSCKNDSFLIIRPISELSKRFFQYRDSIKLIRKEYAIDTTIKFIKIIYHTTDDCLPPEPCPVINLQIDNNMSIYLDGVFHNKNYKKSLRYTGQFTGILSPKLYKELIYLLQTCYLRNLTFDRQTEYHDSPERTFIIYFNNQRKYLKSTNPPLILIGLIDFLNTINSRNHLTRTNEKMNLEE